MTDDNDKIVRHEIDVDEIIAARDKIVEMIGKQGLDKNATLVAGMGLLFVESVRADMMQIMQNLQWLVRIYHMMVANEKNAEWRGGYSKEEIN